MIIDSVTVGSFQENCYLITDETTHAAVLVDPGDELEAIVSMVARRQATPCAVWLTHAHLDHIGAVQGVRRAWPGIPVYLHPLDLPVYAFGARAAALYNVPWEQPDPPEHTLTDGQTLSLGSLAFEVWHVPGHAPGHVAFVADGVVVGGDCIFAGSVGRTDLPGADPAAFVASLERLMKLPDASVILPGHGPRTTIGRERTSNPFLSGLAVVPGPSDSVAPVSPHQGRA